MSELSFTDVLETLGETNGEFIAICHEVTSRIPFNSSVMAPADVTAHLNALPADADVWFSVNPITGPARRKHGRGKASDVTRVAALIADLDFKPDGCGNEQVAHQIILELSALLGSDPVFVTFSGHGLQPYWLVEDGQITEQFTNAAAQALWRRWRHLVRTVAERYGAAVDPVFDLARVLRVPGTINHKDTPIMVHTLGARGVALSINSLTERFDEAGIPEAPVAATGTASDPGGWGYGDAPCAYALEMIAAWETDGPQRGRHPTLLSRCIRLAAAHRNGCLTGDLHETGKQTIETSFRRWCADGIGGARRAVRADEVVEAFADAQAQVAVKSVEDLADELGKHSHEAPAPSGPRLEDARIGVYLSRQYLQGRALFSGALGWMEYDRDQGRWREVHETRIEELIRRAVLDLFQREAHAGADPDRLRALTKLMSVPRMRSLRTVARAHLAVHHEGDRFDSHHDLLNVGNGVVDLRDGSLHPHDPTLMFTKVAAVDYVPGATHKDWTQALQAVPEDSRKWLQLRFGQGITGYPTPDDVLLILQGGGANGKSTIVDGVRGVLGFDYSPPLPNRVLQGRNNDHPTEMMALRGARLTIMEEVPEGHINTKQLKDTHGTGMMTARYVYCNNVSWHPSHTMIVTTNHRLRIDDPEHATWRRLGLLEFPYRYCAEPTRDLDRPQDATLRDRLRHGQDGQHLAILAWLVAGAVRWFAAKRVMPAPPDRVTANTAEWRDEVDVLTQYFDDNIERDPGRVVMAPELLADFLAWARDNGYEAWSAQRFAGRLRSHVVLSEWVRYDRASRQQTLDSLSRRGFGAFKAPPARFRAWWGIRFRNEGE